MDWSNERYVRAYIRDTADYKMLSWQARGLWWELLRKADRSGVLACKKAERGLAALVNWPIEVVKPAVAELVDDGCLRVIADGRGFVIPNYLEANEAVASDALRQRESRDRRRLDAVTFRDKKSRAVTDGHALSRDVTNGHAASRAVTPSLAVPSLPNKGSLRSPDATPAEVAGATVKRKPAKPKPASAPTPEETADALKVMQKLAKESGIGYRCSDNHIRLIVARLRDGVTEEDLRKVIVYCVDELGWGVKKPEMAPYLRPETLFGPQAIERYLDAARSWWSKHNPQKPAVEPAKLQPKQNEPHPDLFGAEPAWWGNKEGAA